MKATIERPKERIVTVTMTETEAYLFRAAIRVMCKDAIHFTMSDLSDALGSALD